MQQLQNAECRLRTISKEMAKKLADVFETSPAEFI
jgi:plasmid maintenance system antidote protein VapI